MGTTAAREPLTSVILPSRDQLGVVRACVNALIRHTRPPFELIVVDAASTDGTPLYLRGLADAVLIAPPAPNAGAPTAASAGAIGTPPPVRSSVPARAFADSGIGASGGSPATDPGLVVVPGNGGASPLSFTYFPVYTVDWSDGTLMVPGYIQYGTVGDTTKGWMDLRAQVRDTTVSSYAWDTTNLTQATNITGTSTYRLQFKWGTTATPTTNSVTLTVTDVNGHQQVETYSFLVPAGNSTVSGGAPTVSWPETLAPSLVVADAPVVASHNVSVSSNTGAAETAIALPSYNPSVPALVLQYDSLLADPRPIVIEHHALDPAQSVPTKVSAALTYNGNVGTAYFYNTTQFNAGAVEQIALQATSTAPATGRYSYTVTVADYRTSTTTLTINGTDTLLNGSADATNGSDAGKSLGAGWTVAGLERITSVTGGVILDLGAGDSLWFTSSGGGYTTPAGDFSTLAAVSGGGYTRTMPDGTVTNFDSSGRQTSVVDTNGLRTSYAYTSGRLVTITDPYNNITTLSYDGSNKLQTIADPVSRVVTFTHSGGNLSGVTFPDSSVWSYTYDSAGRVNKVTDARSNAVTVVYDSANRVGTITRPDSTTETFTAYQERGYDTSGTSGSPAPALLMAEARASYTDPRGYTSDLRPTWSGFGLTGTSHDPDGNVRTYDRDANGLPTITIDKLNRVSQDSYDTKGNVVTHVYADLNKDVYTYNSFAEPLTFKNARGYTTTYTYDSHANMTNVLDARSNLTTMTYTADGMLQTATDARNNTTTYQYDSQDRVTTITFPGSATRKFAYDSQGHQATVTDERGNSTVSSFDAMNRRTGTTDALSNKTTYTYDSGGNVTRIDAPLSRTITLAYDSMDRLTTYADALSHTTVSGYDASGNLVKVTDALSRTTTYQVDDQNRRTVVIDPMANRSTVTYDAEGQVVQVADRLNRITTYNYGSRGWVATKVDALGNTTTYTYTATGKTSAETNPASGGASLYQVTYDELDRRTVVQDGLSDTVTTVYDAVGNVSARVDANSNRNTYTYDPRERKVTAQDALSNTTTFQYDDASNQTVVVDPLSHRTTTSFDALNRATTIVDALGNQTRISYDAAGRRSDLTDSVGNHTTWSYDTADRLTTVVDALGTVTFSYDAANQVVDQTDRDAHRITFAYDQDGRRTNERWLDSSGGTVRTITYTYDAEGERTGATDPDATLTFTYDSGGNQITAVTSGAAGQPSVTLTSGYDALHERTTLSDNLSSTGRTTFGYDGGQRMKTVAQSFGGTAGPQVVLGYDSGGRMTSESRTIGGSGTAVNTTIAYDNPDRAVTITHQTGGGTALATYVYSYDNASRLTSETNAEGSVSYTYDVANELTGVTGARSESYSYDSGGNRTMAGYTTGAGNEMTAAPSYTFTYDAEGNTTGQTNTSTGVSTTFSYDFRDRLTGLTLKASGGGITSQETFTYDALNHRIGMNVSGTQTWTVYDGQNPYSDFSGAGMLQQRYLYGRAVDEIFARTDSGGNTAWYLTDRLGSVRDVVNSSGSVIFHTGYDSFGNPIHQSGTGGDRFAFTGREYDANSGMYYYRARFYAPSTGRFVARDPAGFGAKDGNLYRYVFNSPVNAIDPTGRQQTHSPDAIFQGPLNGMFAGGLGVQNQGNPPPETGGWGGDGGASWGPDIGDWGGDGGASWGIDPDSLRALQALTVGRGEEHQGDRGRHITYVRAQVATLSMNIQGRNTENQGMLHDIFVATLLWYSFQGIQLVSGTLCTAVGMMLTYGPPHPYNMAAKITIVVIGAIVHHITQACMDSLTLKIGQLQGAISKNNSQNEIDSAALGAANAELLNLLNNGDGIMV